MRITNQHIERSTISRLQASSQALDKAREQVSTGRRINSMSDDPGAGSELVRTDSSLRAITQYKRNVSTARVRSSAEESVLDQLTSTVGRAIELAVQGASSTSTAVTRANSKAEIDQALAFAVSLGNTKVGDNYLFGGTRALEQPLKSPPTTSGPLSNLLDAASNPVNPSGGIPLEIRDGYSVTPNHNATQVFIDTNALQALRDLSAAFGNNDVPGINAALGSLQGASDNVQSL
ncbi:MAG: flagellar hook-associated protein FlgL, partial [Gemmatimonadota bacterium]|nr:flagellar hook-associated protein FlgL [Gemmatimonadota bacterium]